jgi:hypothetical protein
MLTPSLESKQSGRPVTSSTHTQVNQAREQECLNAEVAIIAAAIADGFRTGIGVPELHARTVALIADIAAHAPAIIAISPRRIAIPITRSGSNCISISSTCSA